MNPSILTCQCDPTPDPAACSLARFHDRATPPRCPCLCHRLVALERPVEPK